MFNNIKNSLLNSVKPDVKEVVNSAKNEFTDNTEDFKNEINQACEVCRMVFGVTGRGEGKR